MKFHLIHKATCKNVKLGIVTPGERLARGVNCRLGDEVTVSPSGQFRVPLVFLSDEPLPLRVCAIAAFADRISADAPGEEVFNTAASDPENCVLVNETPSAERLLLPLVTPPVPKDGDYDVWVFAVTES